jgi:hypothetical protein
VPRRRRHVRGEWHDYFYERKMKMTGPGTAYNSSLPGLTRQSIFL